MSIFLKTKKSVFYIAVFPVLILIIFTLYYFYYYLFPYQEENIIDISNDWDYYTDSDNELRHISNLRTPEKDGEPILVNAGGTLYLNRVLENSNNDSIMVKRTYQHLKVYADERLIYESPQSKKYKNPGVGLYFIHLPEAKEVINLRLELSSPYAAYATSTAPVYLGTSEGLYAHIIGEAAPHLFFLFACIASGFFFICVSLPSILRGNKEPFSEFFFGTFSILWGLFCICRDDIICLLMPPVMAGNVGIILHIVYLIPLMAYFYCIITICKRFTFYILMTFCASAVICYALQIFNILDFPDMLSVVNPLQNIFFVPFIIIAVFEFIRGNPLVRFITPGAAMLILTGIGTIIDYYYYSGTGPGTSLYLLAIFSFIASIWYYHLRGILRQRAEEKNLIRALQMKNELTLKSYEEMTSHLKQVRILRHEMNHHFAALTILTKNNDMERISEYLRNVTRSNTTESIQFSENPLVDSILSASNSRARDEDIQMDYQINIPKNLSIQDADLCSLLMNMLDNAIEANLMDKTNSARSIRFKMSQKSNFLIITCENTHNNKLIRSDHFFKSTKAEKNEHGYGIAVMDSIAQKYGSLLDISYDKNIFCVKTVLQLP